MASFRLTQADIDDVARFVVPSTKYQYDPDNIPTVETMLTTTNISEFSIGLHLVNETPEINTRKQALMELFTRKDTGYYFAAPQLGQVELLHDAYAVENSYIQTTFTLVAMDNWARATSILNECHTYSFAALCRYATFVKTEYAVVEEYAQKDIALAYVRQLYHPANGALCLERYENRHDHTKIDDSADMLFNPHLPELVSIYKEYKDLPFSWLLNLTK